MPSITGKFSPTVGPLIRIAIMPYRQGQQNGRHFAGPSPDAKLFMALMDTGASATCVSSRVIDSLELAPIGKSMLAGSTGATPVNQYAFNVGFITNPKLETTGLTKFDMEIRLVQGATFENHNFAFDVLMGRDLLCLGAFSMSMDGHYVLSV